MTKDLLNSLVSNIFESKIDFSNTFGTDKLMDAKYMLVSDVLSEDIDKLSSVIETQLKDPQFINREIKLNNYQNLAR